MIPTPRLATLLAAGTGLQVLLAVGAPDLAPAALGAWVIVGLGLALVDWSSTPSPNSIGFERDLPPVVRLEERAEAVWRLANPHDRPVTVSVADELAPSLRPRLRRTRLTLPAHGRAAIPVGFQPSRRGRYSPAEVVVRTEGPLRLAARQTSRRVPGVVHVHPRFLSWKEAEIRINQARLLHSGTRSIRVRGAGTDFDHLRDYTVDDETRRIDWAATARSGRPIVKTFRAERNQTVLHLLDSGRVMAGRVAEVPRLEHAMDAVMTLSAVASGLGDRCGLAIFDRDVHTVVGAAGGPNQVSRLTEAMYAVEPALVESDYLGAFAAALARFRRRTLLVIHTELNPSVVSDTLLPALPLIVRHHVVIVCAVRDPQLVEWSTAPVGDGDQARRRAAAIGALRDRDSVAAHLVAAGAEVVDEPAGRVAARLADTYLRIKSSGRL